MILPLTSSSIFASISSRTFVTVKESYELMNNKQLTKIQSPITWVRKDHHSNNLIRTKIWFICMWTKCKNVKKRWNMGVWKSCICQLNTQRAKYDTTSSEAFIRFLKVKLVNVIEKFIERFLRLIERLKKKMTWINRDLLIKNHKLLWSQLPSSVTARLAEQDASPAILTALQVYCPACSEKVSTMISVAVFVISSKWKTTFLVGFIDCWLWNQLISGFGMPDTRAWNLATSPWTTTQLTIGWIKVGLWPIGSFWTVLMLVKRLDVASDWDLDV